MSASSFSAYMLTIDACPYAFGTAGCPSTVTLPSGYAAEPGDFSAEWVVQVGALAWPRGRITERLGLNDAQLSVGGLDFEIHERDLVGGIYDGEAIYRLFAKRSQRIAQSGLSASFDAGDAALSLLTSTGFPSGPQVVWCEQEALLVSRSGTTLTVSASPAGWGYYGSRIDSHRLDDARGYSPIVFAEFPGVSRRRATLWRVNDAGEATALWRGRVSRHGLGESGATYSLSCDHVWSAIKDTRPGVSAASVTIGGWSMPGADSAVQDYALLAEVLSYSGTELVGSYPSSGDAERLCASLEDVVTLAQSRLQTRLLASAGLTQVVATIARRAEGGIEMTVTGPITLGPVTIPSIREAALRSLAFGASPSTYAVTDNGALRTIVVTLPPESVPAAFVPARRGDTTVIATVTIDTTVGLPSSFARTTVSASPLVTLEPVLQGEFATDSESLQGLWLVFRPSSIDADEGTATGTFEFVPKRKDLRSLPRTFVANVEKPQALTLYSVVTADHWIDAIDYGLVASDSRRSPIDARDWSRNGDAVRAATDGVSSLSRVRWYLDGERTFGDLVTSQARLFGCAVAPLAWGTIGVVPLRPVLPTDAVAATLTAADYTQPPRYELLGESVLTSARFKSGSLTVEANDIDAEARYGETRSIELEAVGVLEGQASDSIDTGFVAQQLLRYVLGSWSGEAYLVTLSMSESRFESVRCGDALEFDAFNVPDGDGGFGLVGARGQVIGREAGLSDDSLSLSVLVFTQAERTAAVAPCWRVQSISGAEITVAIDYLAAAVTDYAGSNASSYRYATSAGEDGGTSWCQAGWVLAIITRDATTELRETGLIVDAVDPSTRKITLTAAIPATAQDWTAFVAGGGIADLVVANYGSATTSERAFAYVGGETTGVISGSSDAPNRWAP